MGSSVEHVIVSAANRRYFLGAYLLAASLRRAGMEEPLHLLAHGFRSEETAALEAFKAVKVHAASALDNVLNQLPLAKTAALLNAPQAQHLTWIDSDCMVTGDISALLTSQARALMIRVRGPKENRLRFRNLHAKSDAIPEDVLKIWRNDVGERSQPAIDSTAVTNVITFHADHVPFIHRWKDQIARIVEKHRGSSKQHRIAYQFSSGTGISDELIFNSLLAYSGLAPPIGSYPLDRDPGAMLIHFGLQPKPWQRWSPQTIRHFGLITETIDWARDAGYPLPAGLPWHFDSARERRARLQARITPVLRLNCRTIRHFHSRSRGA
ncbi:MAG: hypothetical protein HYV27_14975 [Candidatus Hydrogenedentes bacterium]|nr:hypothetical protein [Candidatus Hydrogenedentota bacterium]